MSFIQKTQEIRQRGKLHWFLIIRIRLLLAASLVMGAIFAYNVTFDALEPLLGSTFVLFGFLISLLVFSKMDAIRWDPKKRKIAYRNMDIGAILLFILYIVFQVIVYTTLKDTFAATAVFVALALMFGSMCGRTAALALKINTIYENR